MQLQMRLRFLGTGTSSGVPMIGCDCETCKSLDSKDKRLRCSALLEWYSTDGECRQRILIDAGPDFRQQMLSIGIRHLDTILLTHEHMDHIGGLDDVRAFNYINQSPMHLYALDRVLKAVRKEFAYAFGEHRYPGVPDFELHPIDDNAFTIGNVEILPVNVMHYKLPILGFRIGPLAYITDGSFIEDKEIEKLKGAKVLVINTIRREPHISHFSLSEALEIASKIGAPQTFLTHLSHQLEPHAQLCSNLPAGVSPAYDGLCICL